MCNTCKLDQVYDLSKTNWLEMDLPVKLESSLMKLYQEIRGILPRTPFFMGYYGSSICFGTDYFQNEFEILNLINAFKKGFNSKIGIPKKLTPNFIVLEYQIDIHNDIFIESELHLEYDYQRQLTLMHDQVQVAAITQMITTKNTQIIEKGIVSFSQSGIKIPYLTSYDYSQQDTVTSPISLIFEEEKTLGEFIYAFQRMGVSLFIPTIKGIDEYSKAVVSDLTIHKEEVEGKYQVTSINLFFELPDFSNYPQLYLRQVSGNIFIHFHNEDFTQTQSYTNINAITTYESENYFVTMIKKSTDFNNVQEFMKMYPLSQKIMPVLNTIKSYSKLIHIQPHLPIFPQSDNFNLIINRLGIDDKYVQIVDPHVKVMNNPIKVIKLKGQMTVFEVQDSEFDCLLSSISGDLYVQTKVTFENSFAENAFTQMFNLQKLELKEEKEISAFKVEQMIIQLNNENINNYAQFIAPNSNFLDYGIRIDLDMKLKRLCQTNIFCSVLSQFYGSQESFSLSGYITPINKQFTLQSSLNDITFNNNYTMNNCTLNFEINYEDFDEPHISIYIKGIFNLQIEKSSSLRFLSEIHLNNDGTIKLKGEMNDIYVDAFNFQNLINMTQITVNSQINSNGELQEIELNGVGIFGQNCYRIQRLPEIFNNQPGSPQFDSYHTQQMQNLVNQTFINEDNCQIGNMKININPGNYEFNNFYGQVNVKDLSQFYKMFFPAIQERIRAITPISIREESFINSQLDLSYEPGNVTINGVDMSSTFVFNGLIDFHGLQSALRIVLDPNNQQFLYFSFTLPQFTMSFHNFKFLTPLEFMQPLSLDQRTQLNEFGPSIIEVQIPIENLHQYNQPVKFSLKGMVSVFDMTKVIDAQIQNSRLSFSITGKPFKGLFNVDLMFTTQISQGDISQNTASVYGKFQMDKNIEKLEQELNQQIKQWQDIGLRYLNSWEQRIASLQDYINTKNKSICDPTSCPHYRQCSDNLHLQCKQQEEVYECVKSQSICTDLQQKCVKVETICAREVNGNCLSKVEVCQQWKNICIGYNQQVCKRFRLKTINNSCEIFDLKCLLEERRDESCVDHCTNMQNQYQKLINTQKYYKELQSKSKSIFSNFKKLNKEYIESIEQQEKFLQIKSLTIEDLMDKTLVQDNTNITIQILYNSRIDNQTRVLRSSIDFQSLESTSLKLLPIILKDICHIYNMTEPIATQLPLIIEQLEGNQGNIIADQIIDEIQKEISNMYTSSQNLSDQKVKQQQDEEIENIMNKMIHDQENSQQNFNQDSNGIRSETISDQSSTGTINEDQLNLIKTFLNED